MSFGTLVSSDQVLFQLPRNLKSLTIGSVVDGLSTDCFEGLPGSMERFALDTSLPQKPSVLLSLPKSLTTLQMQLTEVSDEHMKLLPRSLTHMQLHIAVHTLTTNAVHSMPPNLDLFSQVLYNRKSDPIMSAYNNIRDQDPPFLPHLTLTANDSETL
jgi:hypothetical protein